MITLALLSFFALWICTALLLKNKKKSFWVRHLIGFIVGFLGLVSISASVGDDPTNLTIGLVALIVFLFIMVGYAIQSAEDKIKQNEQELELERQRILEEVEPLRQYETIVDAEKAAQQIRDDASAFSLSTRNKATAYAENLKKEADSQRAYAEKIIQAYKTEKYAEVDSEIFALKSSKEQMIQDVYNLKEELIAIKNQINGYGDEWIVPRPSFIDDLADEFEFNAAGKRLKDIRADIKMMVKTRIAAACEYVEPNRKETAINFVVDACV